MRLWPGILGEGEEPLRFTGPCRIYGEASSFQGLADRELRRGTPGFTIKPT